MAELGRASASHPGIGTLTAPAKVSRGAAAAYAALFLLAAFLCLWQLAARRLWGDEAETAVLAVNIVRFGLPITLDERNEITNLPNRQDANEEHVWIWSPWLKCPLDVRGRSRRILGCRESVFGELIVDAILFYQF